MPLPLEGVGAALPGAEAEGEPERAAPEAEGEGEPEGAAPEAEGEPEGAAPLDEGPTTRLPLPLADGAAALLPPDCDDGDDEGLAALLPPRGAALDSVAEPLAEAETSAALADGVALPFGALLLDRVSGLAASTPALMSAPSTPTAT